MSNVLVKDPTWGWIPGVQRGIEKGKAIVDVWTYPDEQSIACDNGKAAKGKYETRKVDLKDYENGCLPLQNVDSNGNLTMVADMVKLPYLHEAGILFNMKKRHIDGKPYTRTGDIVIAINPFQWFTHLYTESQRSLYSNKIVWSRADSDPRDDLEPHVYECSSLSYKGLAFDKIDQSILVSGESGAGKTETVKIAMNHMASVQQGPKKGADADTQDLDPVVKRVVESNPLLETFGNASTRRNDNSSRFGKYLCLQFDNSAQNGLMDIPHDRSTCTLAGSKCDVYLLEKNRVTYHDEAERTYHVFYQLLSAPDSEKVKFWDKLKGTNLDSFKFVGHTSRNTIEGMTDEQHYFHTCKILAMVGVEGEKLKTLMVAVTVVLMCGNLTFGPLDGDKDKSEITSKKEVSDLAELMGVDMPTLTKAFTERTMKTRTETYKVPLKPEVGKEAAESFGKEVYGKLFLWVVAQVNAATRAEDNYKGGTMTEFGIVGLLDIFGFESFARNRFEQLCINYANEKLQQKFTEDVFQAVQAEYEAEGIELDLISYDDNTDVLDLIEGRGGLLAMLNEECVRPKGNDKDFVNKALTANSKSECLLVNKYDKLSFGIHHYAGKVMYDADGFVAANQDTLPTDLIELGEKSSNEIISKPALEDEPEDKGPSKGPKRQKSNLTSPTIWVKYKIQLSSLMGNLRKTSSRYIRCIKPNTAKKPLLMEHMSTVEQLRCAGVVAAVTLARSAFPNNLSIKDARYRYRCLWDRKEHPSKAKKDMPVEEQMAEDCKAILESCLKHRMTKDKNGNLIQQYAVGRTKAYFKAGAIEYLEGLRADALKEHVIMIQKYARIKLARLKVDEMQGATKRAEREAREKAEREERERREKAEKEEREKREAAARAERAKREAEEAERRRLEEERLAAQRKKEEEARIAREKAEAEARKKAEELARLKAEKEEKERLAREEQEAKEREEKFAKKMRKLEKEKEKQVAEDKKKMKEAEKEIKALEERKAEIQAKYDALLEKAGSIPADEIEAISKKVEESDKIVAYLKKENSKMRDETEKMQNDLTDLKKENSKLVEANASAGASIDSLEKQKNSIAEHNVKLEENLKKWKAQNNQLKSDLANRAAYLKAETKIRAEYEKAMEKIVQILEKKSNDHKLLQEVTAAQLQCEAIAAHKTASNPGLASSDVSDF